MNAQKPSAAPNRQPIDLGTRLSLTLPDARGLRLAPERSALTVLDVALAVAEHALHAEHPTLDEVFGGPPPPVTPTLLTASLLVRRCDELRQLIAVYDAALRAALGEACLGWHDDIPF